MVDFAKEMLESSSKHYSKGVSLSEQEKHIKAIKEFNQAIISLYSAYSFIDKNAPTHHTEFLKLHLKALCNAGEYVAQIVNSAMKSGSMHIINEFDSNLRMIVDKLKEHEESLTSSQKDQLERFSITIDWCLNEGYKVKASELELSDNLCYELESNFNKLKNLKLFNNSVTISDSSCFIATAAYSTSIHPDLDTFREFRDRKLLSNSAGKLLVSIYYKLGPILASFIDRLPVVKLFIRKQLVNLAKWMRTHKITNK